MAGHDDSISALFFWSAAALTSAERVISLGSFSPWSGAGTSATGLTKRADAALMVLALRNVLRAATWLAADLRPHVNMDVDGIILGFEGFMPGLVNARDALEHFDEYAVGRGRLQTTNSVSYDFQLVVKDSRPVVTVGPIEIDVENARDAGRWLVIRLLASVPLGAAGEAKADRILNEVIATQHEP